MTLVWTVAGDWAESLNCWTGGDRGKSGLLWTVKVVMRGKRKEEGIRWEIGAFSKGCLLDKCARQIWSSYASEGLTSQLLP